MKQWLDKFRERAEVLEREARVLVQAYRHPRTPWYARALAVLVLAHTFSPIDLIPDFIPVLGVLDDWIITPLGIALVIRLIPPEVMVEAAGRWKKPAVPAPPCAVWGRRWSFSCGWWCWCGWAERWDWE